MAKISIDNGMSFTGADRAPERTFTSLWPAVVQAMDDGLRERLHFALAGSYSTGSTADDNRAFLAMYLDEADDDLVVG